MDRLCIGLAKVFRPLLRHRICLLATASVIPGCVMPPMSLQSDQAYPSEWSRVSTLGRECRAIAGTYANEGVLAAAGGQKQAVTLMRALELKLNADHVTLDIQTRRPDRNGDTFATLGVASDLDGEPRRELSNCFCIRETLACPQVSQSSWSFPNVGIGASQTNVYLSVAEDGSLIAKLQNYHLDVILVVPVYGDVEPWARFERTGRQ